MELANLGKSCAEGVDLLKMDSVCTLGFYFSYPVSPLAIIHLLWLLPTKSLSNRNIYSESEWKIWYFSLH